MSTYVVSVKDGKPQLTVEQRASMDQAFIKLEGEEVRISIEKPSKDRTGKQNKYYWGVVLAYLADDTGHTTEEVHEEMKDKFLTREYVTVGGLEHQIEKTTTTLTTKGFSDYIDQVIAFCGIMGISVPPPGHEG